jgi:hypothetical protein
MSHRRRQITINEEESKESFGEDIFEMCIRTFMSENDGGYEAQLKAVKDAFDRKDGEAMKKIMQSLKTNARFLVCEEVAVQCGQIELYVKEGAEQWDLIGGSLPQFYKDFSTLHEEAGKIYEREYKEEPASMYEPDSFRRRDNDDVIPEEAHEGEEGSTLRETKSLDFTKFKQYEEEFSDIPQKGTSTPSMMVTHSSKYNKLIIFSNRICNA